MRTPQQEYDMQSQVRRTYIDRGDALARISLDEFAPDTSNTGSQLENNNSGTIKQTLQQPFSTINTSAFTGLAGSIHSVMFPVNTRWQAYGLASQLDLLLDGNPDISDDIKEKLDRLLDATEALMDQHQFDAHSYNIILRTLIYGQVLVCIEEDSIRIFPIHDFVSYWYRGKPAWAVIKEQYVDSEDMDNPDILYTKIDWRKGTIHQQLSSDEVVTQISTDESPIEGRVPESSVKQYFIVTTNIPVSGEHYAFSYGMRYFGALNHLNEITGSLQDGAHQAAKNNPVINKSSAMNGITPAIYSKSRPGQILVGDANDVKWITSGAKLSEWNWIGNNYIPGLKEDIAKAFGLGLLQRPEMMSGQKTAYEISALLNELTSQIGSHIQTLAMTFQQKAAEGYLAIIQRMQIRAQALRGEEPTVVPVVPYVTAGLSVYAKEAEFQKYQQLVFGLMQTNQEFAARFKYDEFYDIAIRKLGIGQEFADIIMSEEEFEMKRQQAIAAQQQMQQQMQSEQSQQGISPESGGM